MDMLKITARWSGFAGAPGYSNFYFAGGGGLISDVGQVAARVYNSFIKLQPVLPPDVEISLAPEAAILDADTGEVQSFEQLSVTSSFKGQGTGGYSGATGAVVNWRTGDVRFGRRIRGRTFIVPLAGQAYDSNGSLSTTALTAVRDFAGNLIGGDLDSELGVWSRPRDGSGGVFATATSFNVPDMAAVLRSRRS